MPTASALTMFVYKDSQIWSLCTTDYASQLDQFCHEYLFYDILINHKI